MHKKLLLLLPITCIAGCSHSAPDEAALPVIAHVPSQVPAKHVVTHKTAVVVEKASVVLPIPIVPPAPPIDTKHVDLIPSPPVVDYRMLVETIALPLPPQYQSGMILEPKLREMETPIEGDVSQGTYPVEHRVPTFIFAPQPDRQPKSQFSAQLKDRLDAEIQGAVSGIMGN